jgi:hypothetical protein
MNNMKPDGKEQTTLAPKLPIPVDSKLPYETILDWLERQNLVLADSFAQEFNLSTNQTTQIFRTPKPVQPEHCFKSRHSPHPTSLNSDIVHCKAIEDTIPQYQELTEEGQKDLWLSALASNDTTLIRELTSIRVKNTKANSGTQLAKLAKDLLTHSEKHKVNELKYEEQAGKRRLYFHKWLMQVAAVIKMFSQTALFPLWHLCITLMTLRIASLSDNTRIRARLATLKYGERQVPLVWSLTGSNRSMTLSTWCHARTQMMTVNMKRPTNGWHVRIAPTG